MCGWANSEFLLRSSVSVEFNELKIIRLRDDCLSGDVSIALRRFAMIKNNIVSAETSWFLDVCVNRR